MSFGAGIINKIAYNVDQIFVFPYTIESIADFSKLSAIISNAHFFKRKKCLACSTSIGYLGALS